jgi:hypothetical protein
MAYQPQVPADTLSSAARGYKQYAKFAELDGLDKHSTKVLRPDPEPKPANHGEPPRACLAAHS